MQSKRIGKERLFPQSMAFALLTVMALCLTPLGAAAQQSPGQQSSGTGAPPPAQQAQPAPGMAQGPESVHILVGHSLLIHTGSRIKRVLTGNPAVIESVPTSPRELVITAKSTGGSSLMVWDESGQNRTLDVYADLDITPLRNTLDQSFPNTSVEVQSQGGKIMLVGTVPSAAVAEQIHKMAVSFSKDVVDGLQVAAPPRQKQVMLKVRFAEADRGKLTQFGINLFSTGATNTIGTTSTQQFGPLALQQGQTAGTVTPPSTPQQFNLSNLLNVFLYRPDIQLGAIISDLQTKNVLQILAEPNLMVLNGEAAHFLAGGEFPYPVVAAIGTAGTTPTVTIQFKPYGVKLEFVPTIMDDGSIRLKIAPEVSSLDYTNAITISGFTMPALSVRRAETVIELKDGQSFGIAGLLDDRVTIQLSKMPGIGDIPILGQLFRSRSNSRTNTELLVLVTPTIIDPVGGNVPTTAAPQVNMPVQNLDKERFDHGLPSPNNPPTNPMNTPESK
ncbi:MAG: type II and III secretion system protein family protein [Candidatus Korobacteraceae bacterium]